MNDNFVDLVTISMCYTFFIGFIGAIISFVITFFINLMKGE